MSLEDTINNFINGTKRILIQGTLGLSLLFSAGYGCESPGNGIQQQQIYGCKTDQECKGNRVCVNGECVFTDQITDEDVYVPEQDAVLQDTYGSGIDTGYVMDTGGYGMDAGYGTDTGDYGTDAGYGTDTGYEHDAYSYEPDTYSYEPDAYSYEPAQDTYVYQDVAID